MTLVEKQWLFARLLCRLLRYAEKRQLRIAVGEVYRPPETAALYATRGSGIRKSLHTQKLAVDLLLFDAAGKYVKTSAPYTPLGTYWKRLHPLCAWGGDFARVDGGHFSLAHGGVR